MSRPISDWLTDHGLGDYAEAFADNDIDYELLPRLSAEDLRELGLSIGHRRRFLDAVAMLDEPAEAQAPPAHDRPRDRARSERGEAERRQLTVMFCDLVGSTALSQEVDPEELGELIRHFQNAVTGEITRFGGHVARYMGDGVLAYFGWPLAHEDDAERAVRASLSIMEAVAGLSSPTAAAPAARLGIATGLVVVGDLIGDAGGIQEETVVGETPNLAARLQGLAEPGQIVVSAATEALVGELFELRSLGRHDLKGLASAVTAFSVLGERAVESRFAARSAAGLLPLTGRDQELGLLLERWRRARGGEGQVMLLTGEAGIGKSRITRALIDAIADEGHFRVNYQCSPYHEDSALYPAIRQLTFATGIGEADTDEEKLDKLEPLLARSDVDDGEDRALVAALLGIEYEARYGPLVMPGDQVRSRTLAVLIDAMLGLAAEQPVLFLVEDVHWIDPTTLEFIELALDRIERAPVLALLTARPTFEHGFGGHPIVNRLALNRLGRDDIARIIERISGGVPLPASLVEEISEKTDGVPLFVEELTKTVLDSGLLELHEGRYRLARPDLQLAIPSSLHDSLMARLDRLQPVKEVAQVAACIGREFGYRLLASVSPLDDTALQHALDQLVSAELIFRRGTPPESTYTFKHALVRDAAYESLLRSRRQAFHAIIAAEMARLFPAVIDSEPELLAQHYSAAGDSENAIEHWRRAGERSAAMSSGREASGHLERALELLRTLPEGAARDRRELGLLLTQWLALQLAYGPADVRVGGPLARARELAARVGDPDERNAVLIGTVRHTFWSRGTHAALAYADELGETIAHATHPADRMVADYFLGTVLTMAGDERQGIRHVRDACDRVTAGTGHSLSSKLGHNPAPGSFLLLGFCEWSLGRPSRARAAIDECVERAFATSHPLTIATLSGCSSSALELLGEPRLELVATGQEVALRYGFTQWAAYLETCQGWIEFREGKVAEGLALMERGTRGWLAGNSVGFITDRLALYGGMCVDAGEHERARAVLSQALRHAEESGEVFWLTEVYRHLGRLSRGERGDDGAAEGHFRRAMELAEGRGAISFALRAAIDLADLMCDGGRDDEARDLLCIHCDRFADAEIWTDLARARALRARLG